MNLINIINIIILLITLGLIGFVIYRKYKFPQNPPESFPLSKTTEIIIAGILGICLVIVLSFRLGAVPAGLHVDEAGMAYDALSLAKHGTDRFGYHHPAYLINFGGGQNALYTYLASIVVRILGFSIFAIRIPALILALAAAAVFYFLMRRVKGPVFALIGLALFVVLPFSIMHSRWGLESYLFFPLSIMSIAALWLAFKEHKIWQFVLAGVAFGITLYTYAVSYLILPAFLAALMIYALYTKRLKLAELFAFAIPLGLLAVPLILMLAINQGIIPEIANRFFSVPKMWFYRGGEFSLANIPHNLNIFNIIFSQDFLSYNANPTFGTMYYFSIPLVVLGLGIVARRSYFWMRSDVRSKAARSEFSLDIFMLVFFIMNFFCAMILDGPNINRINAIYVPLFYFLAVAIFWLYQHWRWSLVAIGTFYLISFGLFAKWYYFEYPLTVHDRDLFVTLDDYDQALDFAKEHTSGEIQVWVGGLYSQPYIYTALADEIDAEEFQRTSYIQSSHVLVLGEYRFGGGDLEIIDPDDTYVFMGSNTVPDNPTLKQMLSERFGEYIVYYPTKRKK